MGKTLKGACLCEGVEYEVTDPEGMGVCHCTRCQRWTGSSLVGVLVDKDNFKVTKGDDLVKHYLSEFAPRQFCGNCGSSLYDDLGEKYYVAAGLMRELDLQPSFHLQVAFKAPWEKIGDDAPQFAENPSA
jgi:hypothetical protein